VLPVATVGALFVNPLLVSTIGLETYVSIALIIGLLRYALSGYVWRTGLVAGLLVLARPDLAVVDVVVVLGLLPARRKVLMTGAIGVLVALPWHVFSWFVLGSAVPDTFAFKTVAGRFSDSAADLTNGLVVLYGERFPMATALSVLVPVIGAVCLGGWAVTYRSGTKSPAARVVVVAAAAGVAHWSILAFVVQTDPYSWYYAPLLVGLTLAATVTLGVLPERWSGTGAGVVLVGTMCWLVTVAPFPWTTMPMGSNWASSDDYARVASEAKIPPDSVVGSPGEIGTLAYFCHCDIVDWMSDRGRSWSFLEERERVAGPVMRTLLRWNYQNLPITQPAHVDYLLAFIAPGQQAPGAVRSWAVHTSMHGDQVLVLTR
jgi:hypothetical protein